MSDDVNKTFTPDGRRYFRRGFLRLAGSNW
jgi:hypothetical protein